MGLPANVEPEGPLREPRQVGLDGADAEVELLGYLVVAILTGLCALPGGVLAGISIFMMVQQHAVSALHLALAAIGILIALIPAMYLSISWMFALPLIVDKRMAFWPAMAMSRQVVSRHWWSVFGFFIIVGLINLAGILACCAGFFVTFPISLGAMMYAYEDIFSASARPTP